MQVRTKAQLRKDNEELRKIIAEMEIRAANAWEKIYRFYDYADGIDRSQAKDAMEALSGIRGVKRLLVMRIKDELDAERDAFAGVLEDQLECLGLRY